MRNLKVLKSRLVYYRGRLDSYFNYIKIAGRHKNFVLQVFDVARHKIRINTSPIDYYRFEFYKGDKSWEEKSLYVGKGGSTYYPYAKNSVEYYATIDNKFIFKTLLKGFDLPQPKLFFSVGTEYEVSREEDFVSRLGEIKSDIVLKPIDGSCGEGIFIFRYKDGNYHLRDVPVAADKIWESLARGKKRYLVEERVIQKKSYDALNPSSLNTYRVLLIRLDDGELYVARVSMRIGKRGHFLDNLALGSISLVFNNEGRAIFAYDWGAGREITHHPDTNHPLTGVTMECHDEVVALARRASSKFGFLGTTGWDIGVSETGPVIIEGNMFYDTSYNQVGRLGPLISPEIAPRLTKRRFGQKWDKTKVHPRVNRYRIKA